MIRMTPFIILKRYTHPLSSPVMIMLQKINKQVQENLGILCLIRDINNETREVVFTRRQTFNSWLNLYMYVLYYLQHMYFYHTQTNANITGTATQGTVTGLTPHTTYTCTIFAVSGSDGPVSDPITVTTIYQRMYCHTIQYINCYEMFSHSFQSSSNTISYYN